MNARHVRRGLYHQIARRRPDRTRRAIEKVPRLDWAGRRAAEIMPLTFRAE
jgi:hypothetical protein